MKPQNRENAPEWAKKAVWYQIFPERFRNGSGNNDPTLESLKGSYPHDESSPWQVHPWNCDWYKLLKYEKQNGQDIWFNLQRRRYGGDLQGIIDKLDYLTELGVNAIYLNPVFYAPSHHKYDPICYHHIDPFFGPDPQGDIEIINNEIFQDPKSWKWTEADKLFIALIEEIHNRDMKIIIDGVFNHMGVASIPFQDVVKKQQNSEYKNWFKIIQYENLTEQKEFTYSGWFGFKELPELFQNQDGITGPAKDYIFAITERWMDPNNDGDPDDGIDGWRLDVAFCIKHQFWKEWRIHVKKINQEAYLTAEVIDRISELKPYLNGDEFDAVMNYNFTFACSDFFINPESNVTVSRFDSKLRKLRDAFPKNTSYIMQNLLGSHDTCRILSHIHNANIGKYKQWEDFHSTTKGTNEAFDTQKPGDESVALLKLLVIFQMTYIGAPMIYYGDEIGMWGANDPCCRKPMIWNDIVFEEERNKPDQSEYEIPNNVGFNTDLFEHFKKLISIRSAHPVFQTGVFETEYIDEKSGCYGFSRSNEEMKAYVFLNKTPESQKLKFIIPLTGTYIDVLNNNEEYNLDSSGSGITIKPMWGVILIPKT